MIIMIIIDIFDNDNNINHNEDFGELIIILS